MRGNTTALSFKSFRSSLFQKAWLSRRARRSLSAESEIPYRSKAPPKGEFRRSRKRGTAQVGGSPSLHKVTLNRSPLFFWQKRRKRKANKRKTPHTRKASQWLHYSACAGDFAPCEARPTLRALDWRKPLKRLDLNFNAASRCCRDDPYKSQFFNLKHPPLREEFFCPLANIFGAEEGFWNAGDKCEKTSVADRPFA